ncbi:MAG TPA: DmsC/YnfH family molybdoenzyme membrane anchor subunit [Candidatus Limnocylindrales bacterium]|nr:DmsC/YnfH family molybdoenzyme membrane anchor subunit [Candidatus Limnocylindrales bacterium]
MSLLLLDRAEQGETVIRPRPGEQYRFHFDMSKCIGCRCCEVACAEQNGNSLDVNWRRVGEIEGGAYPFTQRFYLSMGCNHCLEPSCLKGCPVNAYNKDAVTGLVLHSASTCIGCGYCTWNCPYGVPQYNPDRGVVGKCDMCFGRLQQERTPACAAACPETAIEIELVNISEWRADHQAANAPGLPSAEQTLSTTRITLPANISSDLRRADFDRVRPEDPHLPLVGMLVLTQLSAGAFLGLAILKPQGPVAAAAALLVAFLSLGASTLHLGRPVFAFRAVRMWRRSWLSREVLAFSLFAAAAAASVVARPITSIAAALGFAGVTASAFIYLVPARPAWNSKSTLADFYLTALMLGPLFLATLGVAVPVFPLAAASSLQLLNCVLKLIVMAASDEFELRASSRLLAQDLRAVLLARIALLIAGGIVLPLAGHAAIGFGAALAGELLSRYLFFVSVVPRNMAASFFRREAA